MLRLASTRISLSLRSRTARTVLCSASFLRGAQTARVHTSNDTPQPQARPVADPDIHALPPPPSTASPAQTPHEQIDNSAEVWARSEPADSPTKPEQTEPIGKANQDRSSENVDLDKLKEKLRLWSEDAAIAVRERADRYTASAAVTFAQLGRELNKVTGYEQIEKLKREVTEQEARIKSARVAAREAKAGHERAVQQRVQSQREVNDLLQRKSTWSDEDVGRFTSLVRQDHLYEQAELRAKEVADQTEEGVDREFTELMRVILNRYHEEQVWSDKIRSASTYGSLTVLGLNMLVFILAIIIVEPWKRRRLAATFEKKLEEMNTSTMAAFEENKQTLAQRLENQEDEFRRLTEIITIYTRPVDLSPAGPIPPTATVPELDLEKGSRSLHDELQEGVWAIAVAASAGAVGLAIGYFVGRQ